MAEQLDKMQQQAPQMQQMQQLAKKLSKCAKCLRQGGQAGQAAKAMGQLQAELKGLQKQLDELQTLDGAMAATGRGPAGDGCPKCGGAGCKQCQGGICPGQGDRQETAERPETRHRQGRGRGQGTRPEAKTIPRCTTRKVRQQVGRGPARWSARPPDPTSRGKWKRNSSSSSTPPATATTDPLSGRRLARETQQQAQEYFDRLREGK